MLQDSFVIIVVIVVIIIIHRLGRGSLQPQKTVSSSRHNQPSVALFVDLSLSPKTPLNLLGSVDLGGHALPFDAGQFSKKKVRFPVTS